MAAYIPGTDVPLFSAPAAQVVVILGLLCFERDLRAVWLVLLLNIVVTLAWQVRAEWAGLALGILAWGFLTGRIGRVIAIGMAGLAVLGMIELADIRLVGRNTEVSLSETVARAIAPIDKDLARKLSPNAAYHAGTAEWREIWWDARSGGPCIPADARGVRPRLWLPPVRLAPPRSRRPEQRGGSARRTASSTIALGYTGWVGVVLFGALQFAILGLLWRAYRLTGQPAGLVWWVMGDRRWRRSRKASTRRSRRSPSTCCAAWRSRRRSGRSSRRPQRRGHARSLSRSPRSEGLYPPRSRSSPTRVAGQPADGRRFSRSPLAGVGRGGG